MREEVLAEMGRRGLSTHALSKFIDRGNTYLNERLKNPIKELTLSDVEEITDALGVNLSELMIRASRRAESLLTAVPEHTNGITPDGYALAAKHHEDNDVNEQDYF